MCFFLYTVSGKSIDRTLLQNMSVTAESQSLLLLSLVISTVVCQVLLQNNLMRLCGIFIKNVPLLGKTACKSICANGAKSNVLRLCSLQFELCNCVKYYTMATRWR